MIHEPASSLTVPGDLDQTVRSGFLPASTEAALGQLQISPQKQKKDQIEKSNLAP